MTKLEPKCMGENPKWLGLNAEGYLLPCCWCDPIRKKSKNYNGKMDSMDQLFQEKFKLENVENMEEIILSDEWLSFFKSLINSEDVPKICQHYCGQFSTIKIKEETI